MGRRRFVAPSFGNPSNIRLEVWIRYIAAAGKVADHWIPTAIVSSRTLLSKRAPLLANSICEQVLATLIRRRVCHDPIIER